MRTYQRPSHTVITFWKECREAMAARATAKVVITREAA